MFDKEEDIIPSKIAYISKSPLKHFSKTSWEKSLNSNPNWKHFRKNSNGYL